MYAGYFQRGLTQTYMFTACYYFSQFVSSVCKKNRQSRLCSGRQQSGREEYSTQAMCNLTVESKRRLVDLGCVWINIRLKQDNIERRKNREDEWSDKYVQIREENIEHSLQLSAQKKDAIYFSCQMKSAFVFFPRWFSMLNTISLSR